MLTENILILNNSNNGFSLSSPGFNKLNMFQLIKNIISRPVVPQGDYQGRYSALIQLSVLMFFESNC